MPSLCSMPPGRSAFASPSAPSSADEPLGGYEQRDAAAAFRRIRQAGQHQVDDVLGQVVIAPGDEDLLPMQTIAALAVRLGAGGQRRKVAARLRLGQIHRPGPLAGDHLRQVERLLPLRPVGVQRLDRARGQHRAEAEGHVGGVHHLEDGQLQRLGQALAAVGRIGRERAPAALGERAVGLREARRGPDLTVLERRASAVAGLVQRGQHVAGEGARRLQHRAAARSPSNSAKVSVPASCPTPRMSFRAKSRSRTGGRKAMGAF